MIGWSIRITENIGHLWQLKIVIHFFAWVSILLGSMVHRLKMGLSLCLPDLADALQQQGGGKVAAWHAEPLQQLSRPPGVNVMKLFIVTDS